MISLLGNLSNTSYYEYTMIIDAVFDAIEAELKDKKKFVKTGKIGKRGLNFNEIFRRKG